MQKGWEKEEEDEFLTMDGERIFTHEWATNAIGLSFLNKNTSTLSDRWWQLSEPILDKERFDAFFTEALRGYLAIQHEEIKEEANKILE